MYWGRSERSTAVALADIVITSGKKKKKALSTLEAFSFFREVQVTQFADTASEYKPLAVSSGFDGFVVFVLLIKFDGQKQAKNKNKKIKKGKKKDSDFSGVSLKILREL